MGKEFKVSELAMYWGCSVPTTWNRIRKEGLQTFQKIDENGKEITFLDVPEHILKKFANNVNNTVNNNVNNRNYEEILNNENVNANYNETVNNQNFNQKRDNGMISANELFDKLTSLNNEYNNHIQQLNNELLGLKSRMPMLEDKASREGMYLNEISGLKKENELLKTRSNILLKVLLTFVISTLFLLTIYFTYTAAIRNVTEEMSIKNEPVKQEVTTSAPQAQVSSRKRTK